MVKKMSRKDPDPAGSVINWPHGSVIQDSGSADPVEIFTYTKLPVGGGGVIKKLPTLSPFSRSFTMSRTSEPADRGQ
jgi:hypothetical protein